MKRTLSALTLLGLLTLPALSGCGNTDTPPAQADPTPSSPSTTVSSVATGPAAPSLPPAAKQPTKAGAIAFARYYWTVVDYAQRTGDTTLLRTLESPKCKACAAGRRWLDQISARNGTVVGGQRRVIRSWAPVSPHPGTPDYLVVLRIRTTDQTISGAGPLDKHYAGGIEVVNMSVRRQDSDWKIDTWDLQQ